MISLRGPDRYKMLHGQGSCCGYPQRRCLVLRRLYGAPPDCLCRKVQGIHANSNALAKNVGALHKMTAGAGVGSVQQPVFTTLAEVSTGQTPEMHGFENPAV
jgi:hypothetical protein